jgi:hypothetical protein
MALKPSESQLADAQQNPLIGPAQANIADVSEDNTVNGTFSNTEVKAIVDALGAAINDILAVLEAHGLMKP